MKRVLSFLLCLTLMVSALPATVAAEQKPVLEEGYIFSDNATEIVVTQADVSANKKYEINDVQETKNAQMRLDKDWVLALCTEDHTEIVGDIVIQHYSSDALSRHIPYCEKITSITTMFQAVYLSYDSIDGKKVTLCYDDTGLREKAVYDTTTDTFYYEAEGIARLVEGFRTGSSFEMTKEMEQKIDELIVEGNFEAVREISGIDVIETQNHDYLIQPSQETNRASSVTDGFTDVASMQSHLETHFPQYTRVVKQTYSKYCSALGKYVPVKVAEGRNSYVKKTANWDNFGVGTAVTAIAYFLGGPTTLAVKVLTAVGVVISAAGTISTEVTLYNSAVFTFAGSRIGTVKDTTLYNDDVVVLSYYGKGEFTGGYNSAEEFDWVRSQNSSAYGHSYDSIANDAIYNYNADILVNGYCSMYKPG